MCLGIVYRRGFMSHCPCALSTFLYTHDAFVTSSCLLRVFLTRHYVLYASFVTSSCLVRVFLWRHYVLYASFRDVIMFCTRLFVTSFCLIRVFCDVILSCTRIFVTSFCLVRVFSWRHSDLYASFCDVILSCTRLFVTSPSLLRVITWRHRVVYSSMVLSPYRTPGVQYIVVFSSYSWIFSNDFKFYFFRGATRRHFHNHFPNNFKISFFSEKPCHYPKADFRIISNLIFSEEPPDITPIGPPPLPELKPLSPAPCTRRSAPDKPAPSPDNQSFTGSEKKRWGERVKDTSLEDELRRQKLAEERRAKAARMYEKLRGKKYLGMDDDDDEEGPRFEDCEYE